MIEIHFLSGEDISRNLLSHFHHHQIITNEYIHRNNEWTQAQTYKIRQWDEAKKVWVAEYLREQIKRGGAVVAAFSDNVLVGFGSVDGCLKGETAKYANLTMLFVDDEMKRKGIGKALFQEACKYAKKLGADKLFISAISSVETVTFYLDMGCTDAKEIISDYVDTEEDRYLEYLLG